MRTIPVINPDKPQSGWPTDSVDVVTEVFYPVTLGTMKTARSAARVDAPKTNVLQMIRWVLNMFPYINQLNQVLQLGQLTSTLQMNF